MKRYLTLCSMIFMLSGGCVARTAVMQEKAILDPVSLECVCKDIDVSRFVLVGRAKMAEITDMLAWCKANILVDEVEE